MSVASTRFLPLLLATLLALAGCAEPATRETIQDGDADGQGGADPVSEVARFDAGEGGIEGKVLDDSLLPVPNAAVSLLPFQNGLEALAVSTTDAVGHFAFSHVRPGDYRVSVSPPGFANATKAVEVTAEQVADVSFIVSEVASTEPYADLFIKNGIQNCAHSVFGANLVSLVALRTVCSMFFSGNISSMKFEVPVDHRGLVLEYTWDDGRVAGAWDAYGNSYEGEERTPLHFAGGSDRPTVHVVLRPGEQASTGTLVTGQSEYQPVPESAKNFSVLAQLVYDGARPLDDGAGSACGGSCGGVGFEAEWRYSIYASVFVHDAPSDLERYSAIPDG